MVWFMFAILAAFFEAIHYSLIKKFNNWVDQFVLSGWAFISGAIILWLMSLFNWFPILDDRFRSMALLSSVLGSSAAMLYFKALKITDIWLAIPMISFSLIFIIINSFVVLWELPSIGWILWILLIVIWSYILNITADFSHVFDPIKNLFNDKWVVYMLFVWFIFSVLSVVDKIVILKSDIYFSTMTSFAFSWIILLSISFLRKNTQIAQYKSNIMKFIYLWLTQSIICVFANIALTLQIIPYVIATKRFAMVFSVLLWIIVFKEKNIRFRIRWSLLMILWVCLIVLVYD